MKYKTLDLLDAMGVKKTVTLEELHKEYTQLKQSLHLFDSSINKSMREIRLRKLAGSVAQILAKAQQSAHNSKRKIEKKDENELYDRWQHARKRGNEFSEYALRQICNENIQLRLNHVSSNTAYRGEGRQTPRTEEDLRHERLRYARERGNQYSKLAREPKILETKDSEQSWSDDATTVSLKKALYGNYYNARNRLLYKDSIREYDQEFHLLLLKCAVFEREHEDVRGFLQEKIFGDTFHSVVNESFTSDSDLISVKAALSKKKSRAVKTIRPGTVSAPSITYSENSNETHRKDIGIQVSEESLSKLSEKSCVTISAVDNVSQDHVTFVDAEKPSEERLGFRDPNIILEEKEDFEDTEKDQLQFEDAKSEFKETVEKIGDQV